jgi:hypothetical protein
MCLRLVRAQVRIVCRFFENLRKGRLLRLAAPEVAGLGEQLLANEYFTCNRLITGILRKYSP